MGYYCYSSVMNSSVTHKLHCGLLLLCTAPDPEAHWSGTIQGSIYWGMWSRSFYPQTVQYETRLGKPENISEEILILLKPWGTK